MIIWISGLSASGKTTIGAALTQILRDEGRPIVFLDGDVLRNVWQDKLGYSLEDRRINARRISYLCNMLESQYINVVTAVLYPFPEWIAWNRENARQFYLTLLDVPMPTLESRDPKGLYADARAGKVRNVVGVDIEFDRSSNPDKILFNGEPLRDPKDLAIEIRADLPNFTE